MKVFETITKKEAELDSTYNLSQTIGKKALSDGGLIVGRIAQVRLNKNTKQIEGIITRNFTHKPLYIGLSYISKITDKGVVLNMEPTIFLRNRRVITHEGKIIGKVFSITRKGTKNDLENITVYKMFRKKLIVSANDIEKAGKSIILKKGYNVRQKYFWQKSN